MLAESLIYFNLIEIVMELVIYLDLVINSSGFSNLFRLNYEF